MITAKIAPPAGIPKRHGKSAQNGKQPVVRYRDLTPTVPCPYGNTCRIITGGEGGVANVHVITVSRGRPHCHRQYDETYYVLAGTGAVTISGKKYPLRPGAVAVIPAGTPHALHATSREPLEFIIFGTPPMTMDDPRARPERPSPRGTMNPPAPQNHSPTRRQP